MSAVRGSRDRRQGTDECFGREQVKVFYIEKPLKTV